MKTADTRFQTRSRRNFLLGKSVSLLPRQLYDISNAAAKIFRRPTALQSHVSAEVSPLRHYRRGAASRKGEVRFSSWHDEPVVHVPPQPLPAALPLDGTTRQIEIEREQLIFREARDRVVGTGPLSSTDRRRISMPVNQMLRTLAALIPDETIVRRSDALVAARRVALACELPPVHWYGVCF
jgi:hypothetical protein